jgi:hypothetical protein
VERTNQVWALDTTYGTPSQRSLLSLGAMLLEHVWNALLGALSDTRMPFLCCERK